VRITSYILVFCITLAFDLSGQPALLNAGASIKITGSGASNTNNTLVVLGDFENQNDGLNDGIVDLNQSSNFFVSGNWLNNSFSNILDPSSLSRSDGNVILGNTINTQLIGGISPTKFENLVLLGERKLLTVNDNSVFSTLILDAILDLNSRQFILEKSEPSAILHQSGFIKSETLPGSLGTLRWNTSKYVGTFMVPFGSDVPSGTSDLKFSINLKSAMDSSAFFIFSTYPTDMFNAPLPIGATSLDIEIRKVADRYWSIVPSNPAFMPTVDLTFSYATKDVSSVTNNLLPNKLKAARNNPNAASWQDMKPRGNQSLNFVEINDVQPFEFYENWTLVNLPPVLVDLFAPDAFSPNGDGLNDNFNVVFQSDFEVFEFELVIFNRWGQEVFKTNNQFLGWDGKVRGSSQDPLVDVYTWQVKVLGRSSEYPEAEGYKQKFNGMVTLVL